MIMPAALGPVPRWFWRVERSPAVAAVTLPLAPATWSTRRVEDELV
jgi:hypothetical protein